ncbi:MAG: hypothetical protein B7Y44_10460 [Sphingomonadales bacterium 28-55-16]|nr:MAG: hypothetical protein B7Y44_10460 [Sphingomonadales bacterium 28-55-16]
MLEIAGGVILGGLGILIILWLIGLIAENAEDIASVFGILLAALAVFGVWYFLDSEFPEIDWIKTAFALFGIIILILSAYGYYKSPKMTDKEKKTNQKLYKEILNRNQTKSEKITSIFIYSQIALMFIGIIYASFIM